MVVTAALAATLPVAIAAKKANRIVERNIKAPPKWQHDCYTEDYYLKFALTTTVIYK